MLRIGVETPAKMIEADAQSTLRLSAHYSNLHVKKTLFKTHNFWWKLGRFYG